MSRKRSAAFGSAWDSTGDRVGKLRMGYILLGLLGFGFAAVAEWAALRRIRKVAWIGWAVAAACMVTSVVMVSVEGDRIILPTYVSLLGWAGVVIFTGLFLYSAMIELPLHGARMKQVDGTALVATGTYALTRHPAFLWISFLLICLLLATRSRLLLFAAPLWILADGLYVWFEEKIYFERMFEGYQEYKQHTPMLLPTLSSVRRFLRTWSPVAGIE
jgi:protein-S-isoprenylcysteine O-methyltransferase Ste14